MNNTKNITLNSQIEYWNGQKKSVNRNGLGMNPRNESGTTDALKSGTYRNPINAPPSLLKDQYPPSCYKDTAQVALNELSQFYIKRFKKMWLMQRTRTDNRIQRWVNHSRIHFYFGIWMAGTYQNKNSVSVSDIVEEMQITRTTARKLIADTVGEGWIVTVETPEDKRIIKYRCTQFFYAHWESYVAHTIDISDFDGFRKSIDIYQYCLDKMDKNKTNITPNNG
jgi:DNA-binding MarR family transcriptional regulator